MKVQGGEVGGIDVMYMAAKAEGTVMSADCAARNKQELLKTVVRKAVHGSSSPSPAYPGNDQQMIIKPEAAVLPPLAPQAKSQHHPRQARKRPCDDVGSWAEICIRIWKLCCPVIGSHGVFRWWEPAGCSRKWSQSSRGEMLASVVSLELTMRSESKRQ